MLTRLVGLTPLILLLTSAILTVPSRKAFASGTCPPEYEWNGCECVFTGSPIIVDTTGQGFHLTSAPEGVKFDLIGDGHPLLIAWTEASSGNAFLALDRNGNGKIDNGQELFGNFTKQPKSDDPNGFLALAVFDKPENGGNDDGIIDERDAIFPYLLLWIDENHDGISQPDELHSLPELGVFSLALKYKKSPYTDEFGNQFRYKSAINPDPKDGESKDGRWDYDVFLTILNEQGNEIQPTQLENDGAPPPCPLPQIPTASRIIDTIDSHAINHSTFPICKTGEAGWERSVDKIVTDEVGDDITLDSQSLTESYTIGSPNTFNIKTVNVGSTQTNDSGVFGDQFYLCSPLCPGSSGQTDGSQTITDVLPNGSGPYTLIPNAIIWACTYVTINGQ